MRRRDFSKNLLASLPLLSQTLPFAETTKDFRPHDLVKPARLRSGARVALIAPAGPANDEKVSKALQNVADFGFEAVPGPHMRDKNGYLAGADAERLDDLHWAFADPTIDAVWCVRGGYGTTRLLADVDFKLIARNPKPFIGYSDITALHTAIHQKTGLVTFHGPVGASEFTDFTASHFKHVAIDPRPRFSVPLPSPSLPLADEIFRPEIIRKGVARGRLIGGNLCLLAALVGTPWEPIFKGKIAFIEDIDEKPYRCDRMLTQLLAATDLKKAVGIALGVFSGCEKGEKDDSFTLREMLRDRLAGLGIPVVYGIPFGHVNDQITLPVGIEAELDADRGLFSLLETAVI